MRHAPAPLPTTGTSDELIRAAELGARLAARQRRQDGQDDATIRRELLARFLGTMREDGFDDWTLEALASAVVRGLDQALSPESRHRLT